MYASGAHAATFGADHGLPSTANSGSNFDLITINKNVAVPGDQIELLCGGGNWYATVLSYAYNAVTLS